MAAAQPTSTPGFAQDANSQAPSSPRWFDGPCYQDTCISLQLDGSLRVNVPYTAVVTLTGPRDIAHVNYGLSSLGSGVRVDGDRDWWLDLVADQPVSRTATLISSHAGNDSMLALALVNDNRRIGTRIQFIVGTDRDGRVLAPGEEFPEGTKTPTVPPGSRTPTITLIPVRTATRTPVRPPLPPTVVPATPLSPEAFATFKALRATRAAQITPPVVPSRGPLSTPRPGETVILVPTAPLPVPVKPTIPVVPTPIRNPYPYPVP